MQKKKVRRLRSFPPDIQLSRPVCRRFQEMDPGKLPRDSPGSVLTAAIYNEHFNSTLHRLQVLESCKEMALFIQSRNNERNLWTFRHFTRKYSQMSVFSFNFSGCNPSIDSWTNNKTK